MRGCGSLYRGEDGKGDWVSKTQRVLGATTVAAIGIYEATVATRAVMAGSMAGAIVYSVFTLAMLACVALWASFDAD